MPQQKVPQQADFPKHSFWAKKLDRFACISKKDAVGQSYCGKYKAMLGNNYAEGLPVCFACAKVVSKIAKVIETPADKADKSTYRTIVCLFNGRTFLIDSVGQVANKNAIVQYLANKGIDYGNRKVVVFVDSFELTADLKQMEHKLNGK